MDQSGLEEIVPYLSAHREAESQRSLLGISNKFPINGQPGGPGGTFERAAMESINRVELREERMYQSRSSGR